MSPEHDWRYRDGEWTKRIHVQCDVYHLMHACDTDDGWLWHLLREEWGRNSVTVCALVGDSCGTLAEAQGSAWREHRLEMARVAADSDGYA